jgi:hypothetical protein
MLWTAIAFSVGMVMILTDYRMATAPDPRDKLKRRRKLSAVAARQLRDLLLWTLAISAAVYFLPAMFASA